MAEILGLGLSHYPPFSGLDNSMADILRWTLEDPDIPAAEKDPANWSPLMREEWSDDRGGAAAARHRAAMIAGFEKTRQMLDDFAPDALIVWGDDQYENFREDVVPAYSVQCYDDMELRPWAQASDSSAMKGKPNIWGEGPEKAFTVRGRPDIGKYLVSALLDNDFDPAYSYQPLHHGGLPHAFLNAVLYLDYHRTGFDYPVIPFPINCYGRRVISYKGFLSRIADVRELDPPSSNPSRLMDLGAAVARALRESPWRIALVASSSWSHAFICEKNRRLRPDTESDRRLYAAMVEGDLDVWRNMPLPELEASGQQELLNWFPLLGAMAELGQPVSWSDFVPTEVFNSNKVFATFGAR
jgi:Catalytic LigB subunit of aromatic ring-opening dioxygenase